MFDPVILAAIVGTFLIAGTVKGVIGLGLPTLGIGVLTAVIDLPTAMALILVPSLVTNLWQAVVGGHGKEILRRIWPFLLMATAMVWVGALALRRVDLTLLSAFLGVVLIAYAVLSLVGFRVSIDPRREAWAGPLLGAVNGVVTGMTGSFAVPGVLFLQAIGLSRDRLIQAMGILFTVSTLALAAALGGNEFLTVQLGLTSAAALIPALMGMLLGQRLRRRLPEPTFRRLFFIALFLLGAYIIVSSAMPIPHSPAPQ
jgi:uncharacterized membrane protein YfcA